MVNEQIFMEAEIHEVLEENGHSKITMSYLDRIFEINEVTKTLIDLARQNTPDEIIAIRLSQQFEISLSKEAVGSIKIKLAENLASVPASQLDAIRFKVRLLKPDWVHSLTKPLLIFYNPYLMLTILALFMISIGFVLPGFFKGTSLNHLTDNFNAIAFLEANIIVLAIVIFHELGHATACTKFNVRNGAIGFGLYFVTPVFYSDNTQAWKVRNRQRLLIDFGGIYFQIIVIVPLSYFFYLTRDTLAGYLIFLNYMIILSNLNPLLKYDGYWIISDLLNISNMRQKTTQLFTSFLKSIILGRKNTAGELLGSLPKKARFFIIAYTVVANAFFLYFFGWLLPAVILSLVHQLGIDFSKIYSFENKVEPFTFKIILNLAFSAMLKIFILFSLCRVIYSLIKKIVLFFKGAYNESNPGNPSFDPEIR